MAAVRCSLDAHPISSLIESDRLFEFSGRIQDANLAVAVRASTLQRATARLTTAQIMLRDDEQIGLTHGKPNVAVILHTTGSGKENAQDQDNVFVRVPNENKISDSERLRSSLQRMANRCGGGFCGR